MIVYLKIQKALPSTPSPKHRRLTFPRMDLTFFAEVQKRLAALRISEFTSTTPLTHWNPRLRLHTEIYPIDFLTQNRD